MTSTNQNIQRAGARTTRLAGPYRQRPPQPSQPAAGVPGRQPPGHKHSLLRRLRRTLREQRVGSGRPAGRPGRCRRLDQGVPGFIASARRQQPLTPPNIAVAGRAPLRLTLNTLYQARIRADYYPTSVFDRQAAEHRLDQAEAAIESFVKLPAQERVTIATITLLRDR